MEGSSKWKEQPIVIRHLLSNRPYLRNEATGSLESIPQPRKTFRSGSTQLEQEMDSSVENIFREWDPGIQGPRRRDRSSRSMTRDGKLRIQSESLGTSRGSTDFSFDFKKKGGTHSFDGSNEERFEDVSPVRMQPLYVDCSDSPGQRKFRMEFDAEGFGIDDIAVTLSGMRLEVHAIQEESDGGRKTTSEFCRRIKLPPDVNIHKLNCTLVDGKIIIEAPLLQQPNGRPGTPSASCSSSPSSPTAASLNIPMIKTQDGVRILSLTVEVGRVFRSDDVTVKLKSPSKIHISADRSEVTDISRLSANLVREFDLPASISAQTLKAGMTADGLLRITAHLLQENEGKTAGKTEKE